ncbi:MAG: very short patch repair endonuclease [Sedimentisphaerales bacterium]|jgi:DNA mismatch endonuclease (patch repair protein)
MTDVYTKAKRSEIMARIKGRKTSPENAVACMLRKLKVKFQCNVKSLPGQPDIVIPLTKTVIFVNGCFWHNHANCKRAKLPSTNRAFWKRKILGNKRRDNRINRLLRKMGWQVIRIWQCKLREPERVLKRLKNILNVA